MKGLTIAISVVGQKPLRSPIRLTVSPARAFCRHSSVVEQAAVNRLVAGSIPAVGATSGAVAQSVRAPGSYPVCRGFEPHPPYSLREWWNR